MTRGRFGLAVVSRYTPLRAPGVRKREKTMSLARIIYRGVLPGLLALAIVVSAGETRAQSRSQPGFDIPVCDGEVSSFPLGEIASGQSYWVDIFDPTDEALEFRKVFLESLARSGRATAEDGRLVFSFESESSFLGLVPRAGNGLNIQDAPTRRDPGTQSGVSELRDTIRDNRAVRDGRSGVSPQIGAKAELRDRATGRVVWLATVSCRPLTGDRTLLMEFVSDKIVERLGAEGGKSTFR